MIHVAPDVYFSLEVVAREYAGKLLLAVETAGRGLSAVVGHKPPVRRLARMAELPGIHFAKTRPKTPYGPLGFATVAQDDEAGIVYEHFSDFYRLRPGQAHVGDSDAYLCYGHDDYDFHITSHPEWADRVHLTGSARTYLWGPMGAVFYKEQIENIRSKYGTFVLFAVNEVMGNPAKPNFAISRGDIAFYGDPKVARTAWNSRIAQSRQNIDAYIGAIRAVALRLNTSVVVRPHPVERWDTWRELLSGTPNVFVDGSYDLAPWLWSASAVVQNGSTAAIESRCVGTPTFAFADRQGSLVTSGIRDIGGVPNKVSRQAIGIDELLALLSDVDSVWADFLNNEQSDVLARKIFQPAAGAPKAIADVIASMADLTSRSGLSAITRNRHNGRIRSIGARVARRRPRPLDVPDAQVFKKREIAYENLVRDVAVARRILGLDMEFRIQEIERNCYLLTRA